MSEQIVVGYNGTESSAAAVTWAADEAKIRDGRLRVVCCFEMPVLASEAALGFGAGAAYDVIRDSAQRNADEIQTAVAASHPTVALTVDIAPGPPAAVLLDGVGPDDLVVVGTSSHDGAAAFWIGTTPRHLVHDSPCPVAVVRGSASGARPDRIVVGVDSSPAAARALRWAGDEADRHGAELVVVHAWDYPYTPVDTGSMQGRELLQIDAACELDRAVEAARERCAATVTPVLVEGGPATALLETVRDGDILVIGSRGRGGLRTRLFGSTANSVLAAAAVPVVVVRAEPVIEMPGTADADRALASA